MADSGRPKAALEMPRFGLFANPNSGITSTTTAKRMKTRLISGRSYQRDKKKHRLPQFKSFLFVTSGATARRVKELKGHESTTLQFVKEVVKAGPSWLQS